jgi:hypothetical protein
MSCARILTREPRCALFSIYSIGEVFLTLTAMIAARPVTVEDLLEHFPAKPALGLGPGVDTVRRQKMRQLKEKQSREFL